MSHYALPNMDWRTLYVAPILLKVDYDELTLDFNSRI